MRIPAAIAAAAAGAAIFAFAAPSARAAITFTEGTDFPTSFINPFVIESPLGPGDNVINGTLPGHDTTPDDDIFRLNNPSGLAIDSVTVSFSSFAPSNPAHPATVNLLGLNTGSLSAPGAGLYFLPAVISDPTSLTFFLSGPGVGGSEFITAGSANYILTIKAVPEPDLAALTAGAGSAWILRRRKRMGREFRT